MQYIFAVTSGSPRFIMQRGVRNGGAGTVERSEMCCQGTTICPGSIAPFNLLTHYIKMDKTSWTNSIHVYNCYIYIILVLLLTMNDIF